MDNFLGTKNAFELREFLNGIPAKDLRMTRLMVRARKQIDDTPTRVYGFSIGNDTLESGEEVTEYVF